MTRELVVLTSLLEEIKESGYMPGQRLPDERSQLLQFGVSRTTIRRAMKRLENVNIVERRQGSGTFLLRRPTDEQIQELLVQKKSSKNGNRVSPIRRRVTAHKTYRLALFHDRKPDEPLMDEIISAVCNFADERGHEILIGRSRPTAKAVVHRNFTDSVYNPDVDGMVLSATIRNHDVPNLAKIPVPYVLFVPIGRLPGMVGPISNSITLDLPSACRQAVGELMQLGHQHIAILEKLYGNNVPQLEHVARFLKKEFGLDDLQYVASEDPYPMLKKKDISPTAIYVNDDIYCSEMFKKNTDHCLSLSPEVNVISVSKRGINSVLPPEVGRMEFDMAETGLILAQRLERLLNEGKTTFAPVRIGAEYVPPVLKQ